MKKLAELTNATKAQLVAFINTALVLIVSFGITLSDAQTAAIISFVNAGLSLWIAMTYRDSPKRISDE